MQKNKTIYSCSKCDAQSVKWTGQCFQCGAWGTIFESAPTQDVQISKIKPIGIELKTQSLSSISSQTYIRIKTNISEVDRVLGGGIVPGAILLIGGEPGIGKSTLILQIAEKLRAENKSVLYVSGEESGGQVANRFNRMKLNGKNIEFAESTITENICATIENKKPLCVIIDSIQTISTSKIDATSGSISQIKTSASMLAESAKKFNVPIFLIGHVNKEGGVAGPKTLEHVVDAVFMIEGERCGDIRILRAMKNRFGPVDEIGVFKMTETGMSEISNPSELFIDERANAIPGSVITPIIEGTRPILVEIQALVTKTYFGYPQRKSSGYDLNRLQIICAVLSKRMNLPLDAHDVFLNISGGTSIKERAADLAVAMAIISAYKDKTISKEIVCFGEVGLSGEIRSVPKFEKRIKEAEKLGFTYAIVPKKHPKISASIKIADIENVSQIIDRIS